jgi:hypothetical protein
VKEQDSKALRQNLARISAAEIETYIYHELGEVRDTVFDRHTWRDIIATFPHTPVELIARVIKDLLADTNEHGKLRHIVREKKEASLALYVAFLDGLRKELFPEVKEAFQEFTETGNWKVIEEAISSGYTRAKKYAEIMSHIYREGKKKNDMQWVEKEMEKRLLNTLGMGKAEGKENASKKHFTEEENNGNHIDQSP